MKMKNLLSLLALLSIGPAYADSVVQYTGDTFCKGRNSLDTLVIGTDIPADAVWAPFVKYNDDDDISHYKIVGGVLTHIATNLTPPYRPDTTAFQAAIVSDIANGTLSPNWANYLPLVAAGYAKNPAKAKAFMVKVIASPPAWMASPAGQIQLVKQRAIESQMALQ